MAMRLEDFHGVCRAVLAAYNNGEMRSSACSTAAMSYATMGLAMAADDMVRMQALYIRTNLFSWRGERARRAKQTLDLVAREGVR